MTTTIASLIPEAEAIERDARAEFGALTAGQLNWKPAPERWSVAQCLEHLITIDRAYFADFEAAANGTYRPRVAQRIPLLPSLFGPLVLKGVQPEAKMRARTSRRMQPTTGHIDAGILDRFGAHQRELIEHMRRLDAAGAGRVVIPSPIAAWVSYTVDDAVRIVVAHQRRHLLQARRVTEMPAFPAAVNA